MYYQTNDMIAEGEPPYRNLKQYVEYKNKCPNIEICEIEEDDEE